MRDKNLFINVNKIGELYIDRVFFESNYPILFTCTDNSQKLYLCVCCHADQMEQKWLMSCISPQAVIDLLSDKITIRDAFLQDSDEKYTIVFCNNHYIVTVNDKTDWDPVNSQSLPTPGEYMDAEDGEFAEELQHYNELLLNNFWIEVYTIHDMEKANQAFQSFCEEILKIKTTINDTMINDMIDEAAINYHEIYFEKEIYFEIYDKVNSVGTPECNKEPLESSSNDDFRKYAA